MSKWEVVRTGFGPDYCSWSVTEGQRQMCSVATLKQPDLDIVDWLTGPPEELQARMELVASAVNGCKEINPENPAAAAAAISEMWQLIKDVRPVIEAEEELRQYAHYVPDHADPNGYWTEMIDLAERIEGLISRATAKE